MNKSYKIFGYIISYFLLLIFASISYAEKLPQGLENFQSFSGKIEEIYTSRSCKVYKIIYIDTLGVYTSPDLINEEYFIDIEYFERYIDSKNTPKSDCATNKGRISNTYKDASSDSEHYVAPNGKVYFITQQNGFYTSNELNKPKSFSTINELKNYIRDHNPLLRMGNNNESQTNYSEDTNKTATHGTTIENGNNSTSEIDCNGINNINKIQHKIEENQIILSWEPAIKLEIGVAENGITIDQLQKHKAGYTTKTSEIGSFSHNVPIDGENVIFILKNDLSCDNEKYYIVDFDDFCSGVNNIEIQHTIKGNEIILNWDSDIELNISTDGGYVYDSGKGTYNFDMGVKPDKKYDFVIKNNFWCKKKRNYTVNVN